MKVGTNAFVNELRVLVDLFKEAPEGAELAAFGSEFIDNGKTAL